MSTDSRTWNDGYEQGQRAAAAEIARLTEQCNGLYQAAMGNGMELLTRERKMEETADFLDEMAKRMWVRGEQKSAEECREWAERLRK